MAQPWARLATLLGRVHGQPCQGGSLPWRNIDFFCRWSKGLGSGPRLGGQTGKKFWDCPLVGYVLDAQAQRRNHSALPLRDTAASWSLRGIFLNECHIAKNDRWDVPFSHLGSQACRVPGSLGKNLIGVDTFFSWDPSPFSWGWWPRPPWKNFNWAPCHPKMP